MFGWFAKGPVDDNGVSGLGTTIIRLFRISPCNIPRMFNNAIASPYINLPCNIPRIFNKEVKVATEFGKGVMQKLCTYAPGHAVWNSRLRGLRR